MAKGIIKQIFIEHWDGFTKKYGNNIRESVFHEVKKMMQCGSLENGFLEFKCDSCGETKKVGFTCKSRLCSSCGKIRIDDWVEDLVKRMARAHHRHVIFTIPEELRVIFQKHRKLLELLPRCAADVVKSWYLDKSKKEKFMPGIVAVIHTFGRDLKWNPHVHMLLTEGAMGEVTAWKSVKFLPYGMLRKRWQKVLLDAIESELGKAKFRNLKNKLYNNLEDGFYVYGKNEVKDSKGAAKYIGRYTGRPAIAESRIIKYDGEKVTFFYERHEDNKRIEVELDVFEFIKKVIIHIPEKQFKMIRYYGIYARNNKYKDKFFKLVNEKIAMELKKLRKWEYRILKAFGIDPLKCEKCGSTMRLDGIYYNKLGNLIEKYKRNLLDEVKLKVEELKDINASVEALSPSGMGALFAE
jgi:hypothetical protein